MPSIEIVAMLMDVYFMIKKGKAQKNNNNNNFCNFKTLAKYIYGNGFC